MPHQIRRQKLVIQIDDASQLTFVVDGLGQLRVLPTVRVQPPDLQLAASLISW